jgi:hypothetical protein
LIRRAGQVGADLASFTLWLPLVLLVGMEVLGESARNSDELDAKARLRRAS